jgi:hypothetical protein
VIQPQYLSSVFTIPHVPSPSEVISVMTNEIKFLPAIPIPLVFDVQKRIQELCGYLDPKNPQFQRERHVDIETAVKLYEDGKIDGLQQVHIMEGKIVTEEEMFKGSAWAWGEVYLFKSLPSIRTHLTNRLKL